MRLLISSNIKSYKKLYFILGLYPFIMIMIMNVIIIVIIYIIIVTVIHATSYCCLPQTMTICII